MKNKLKKLLAPLLLLLLIPTIALAASHWRGSDNVENVKTNLSAISAKLDDLRGSNADKDNTIREIETLLEQAESVAKQKENELANKQREIQEKIDEINQKNATIDQKNAEINSKEQELQQALEDIREIEQITEEMAR